MNIKNNIIITQKMIWKFISYQKIYLTLAYLVAKD